MTTLDNVFKEKVAQKFLCNFCNYNTSRKSNFMKHCTTAKHINLKKNNEMTTKNNACQKIENNYNINDNTCKDYLLLENHGHIKKVAKVAKVAKSSNDHDYQCQICNKNFNDRAGLWRHKKKCENKDFEKENIIQFLMNENKEMKQMMAEQNKQFIEIAKNISQNSIINNSIHTNNSHNKTFNLQVFLNETCKDAMNIMDFVNSMEIDLDDLEKVGELGYVNGMTNIILKNLKALDITKRPLHCTDAKREVLYIKDKDKWEKETENKDKMKLALKYIVHKNAKMFTVFKAKYPDCIKSYSNKCDQYNKLVVEVLGGKGDNEIQNNEKIIRRIAREMTIDKTI